MKRKELKVLLEAQLPKSFQSTQPSVEDECDGMRLHCVMMAAIQDADNEHTDSSDNRAQPGMQTLRLHPLLPSHITIPER